MAGLWAGIDWSEQLNDVAVVDRAGTVVARARVPETPEGIKELLRLLAGLRSSHRHSRRHVPVAIETGRGLLVRALTDAGQTVVPINPSVVARYRGRLRPTRQKSDKSDAALLAHILRTDGPLHRPLTVHSDQAEAIQVLARAQRRALYGRQYQYNQLRSLLREVHPAALTAWSELPGNLLRGEARAVLAAAPTPSRAARLTKRHLFDLLQQGGRTRMLDDQAARLRDHFRQPVLRQRPAVEEAMGQQILMCLALLDQACRNVDALTEQVQDAFEAHPQAKIYLSFPGCGALTGARLLAELGDDPDRFADARGLRAYAGAAPLTWASGSSSQVSHRRIANKRLKATGHTWAFATLTRSPGCRALYDARREAGDGYAAALRRVFARLLGCLHHCLAHEELYREDIAFPTPAER
ncbi:IS110 family transposase [Streptomyces misionensis]|uniref:IS110 family transposase n=1 Tax=Streptomyces misionensis TaxID=67331 RepID=UPI00342CE6AB